MQVSNVDISEIVCQAADALRIEDGHIADIVHGARPSNLRRGRHHGLHALSR
jgi:hypothetical protein